MESLPGAMHAGERLKSTALRDFRPPDDGENYAGSTYRRPVDPHEAPVPGLYKYALTLIGLESHGPGEKVAWWVNFTYKGEWCELAHEKFGLRVYLKTEAPEQDARTRLDEITKKLRASMRTVENVILDAAPETLRRGDATVLNQHSSLRRAYEYFRERAENPAHIEDERDSGEGIHGSTWTSFRSGKARMHMHSFHDMVAAISAYLSLTEHVLVLSLAFQNFNPNTEDLSAAIGSRWGEKWERSLGKKGKSARYRQRLTDVVERWRNPYSHGGFEKGHIATVWLHMPIAGAVPVGLTNIRNSPHFSLVPASETEVSDVFGLFDEIDEWLAVELRHAVRWIKSGLDVRFDAEFRGTFEEIQERGMFDNFLEYHEHRQAMVDNMDY